MFSFLTKRGIIEAKEINLNIILAWIAGHTGIAGNLKADTLANIGRILRVAPPIKLPKENFYKLVKNDIWNQWMQKTKKYPARKDTFYSKIEGNSGNKSFFNKFEYKDRIHISTVIRMRTGHCCTPLHLFRVGIKDDPYCECGQVGSLNHLILECPINKVKYFDLYNELVKSRLPSPFDICSILSNLKDNRMHILYKVLSNS